jgi:hypothetical protein
VIKKNKEEKFLMNKDKEMTNKETQEERLGLACSIYMEENTHCQPYLKYFYLSL